MIDKGVIQRIGRGKYTLGKQKPFQPVITEELSKLYIDLEEEFPFLDICLWTTKWITPWMLHVPNNHEIIIEVEGGSEESVFDFLSDTYENIFLNPKRELLDRYAKKDQTIFIVKKLVTHAPLLKVNEVTISSLEKLLVDLIADKKLFSGYQGRDLDQIIENAFSFHTIKKDTMLRYAGRRKRTEEVQKRIS